MKKDVVIDEFSNYIYPRMLWVMNGGTIEQIQRNFLDEYGQEITYDGVDSLACVYAVTSVSSGLRGFLVWIRGKRLTTSDIAHEAVHVAMSIYHDVGAVADANNQEPFAYLVGWAAQCISWVCNHKIRYIENEQKKETDGQESEQTHREE